MTTKAEDVPALIDKIAADPFHAKDHLSEIKDGWNDLVSRLKRVEDVTGNSIAKTPQQAAIEAGKK